MSFETDKWINRADVGTVRQLNAWMERAQTGDIAVYHTGDHLMTGVERGGKYVMDKLDVAKRAAEFAGSGHVTLTQRRMGDEFDGFEYLAVRTSAYPRKVAA